MAGRGDDGHRRFAECDLLAVVSDNVAFRFSLRVSVDGPFYRIPIGAAHYDVGTVPVLHHFGSAHMIGMRMADDHVLDRCGIEPQLFQTTHDLFFRVVSEQRIDENDSLTGGQRPGRVDLRTDEIEVIEDFGRFGKPYIPGGRWAGGHVAQRTRNRYGRNTQTGQSAGEIESSGGSG